MEDLTPRAGRLLLLGIGNTIVCDDGVGVHVARRAGELLPPELAARVDVEEAATGGFDLVEYLQGYGRAVVADAIKTTGGTPGAVYEFDVAALRPTAHLAHVHGVNLAGALLIAEQMNLPMPAEIRVVAVEAEEIYTFTEAMTPAVAAAVEPAARACVAELVRMAADLDKSS
jgi:hydrogenase maturation protease